MTQKTILITGAAGGMGAAAAKRFHAAGWRVLLTDIQPAATAPEGASFMAADLTKPDATRAVAAWAIATAGRVDALINAAGIWREGPTERATEQDFDAVMNVNVKALYFMSSAMIPALRETEGVIINIASDAGIQGNTGAALYSASKGAVSLFTKSLALELAPDGIRVNAVCPGDVATPMLKFQAETYGGGDADGYCKRLLSGYPQGPNRARFITPEEVAGFLFFLCQPDAAPITGATLSMDFGYSAGK